MKVAVIGVGSMGRNHARVYSELKDVRLEAVADTDAALAKAVGSQFGTRWYADYQQMVTTEQPNVVSIAVPTALHEEVARSALQAGAHILVEKPVAATLEEGQRIIDMAHALKRKQMIGHIVRFNPALQALNQKLQTGKLGRIFQVICKRAGTFSTPWHSSKYGRIIG